MKDILFGTFLKLFFRKVFRYFSKNVIPTHGDLFCHYFSVSTLLLSAVKTFFL